MKLLKIVLFLLIGLALIGCNNQEIPDDEDDHDDDIIEPSLSIESTEYMIEEGEKLQLEVEILDTEETLGLIYVSDNNAVASVSTTGLVTANSVGYAKITIIISLYSDKRLDVLVTVTEKTPEDILDAMQDFADILDELDQSIPSTTTTDIIMRTNRYGRAIEWTSSNEKVISKYGEVTRQYEDVDVTLTATLKYKHITEVFTRVVRVEKTQLRDLSNKKISFAYARATNIPAEHLRQIDYVNYSFASITTANKFYVTPYIASLVRQAHNEGTRVVAAIGGGSSEGSNPFKTMTLTKESRKTFIDSMMEAIDEYNLDGIDFDWEVPTAAERNNFSALVRETREAFDAYHRDLILTSAVSAGTWHIGQGYDVAELNKYLDYFHVMTYDLNNWPAEGATALTRHHSHLYRSNIAPSLSADEAIRAFKNAGASSEKLVIGVAAYGRAADVINPHEHGLNQIAYKTAQSLSFDSIYNLYYKNPEGSAYKLFWDDVAKAAWLYSDTLTVRNFISFDDERAIEAKVEYTYDNNLGGIMYWDYLNDQGGVILGFIDKYLNK